jgi:hypothetical protein
VWPRARAHGLLATMAVLLLLLATQMVTLNVGCRHRQVSALALLEEHENRSGFPFRAPERGSLAFWLRACIRRIGLLSHYFAQLQSPRKVSTSVGTMGASPGRSRQAIRIRAPIVRPPSSHGNFRNGHLPISRTLFVTISSVDGHFAPDDSARCTLLHR